MGLIPSIFCKMGPRAGKVEVELSDKPFRARSMERSGGWVVCATRETGAPHAWSLCPAHLSRSARAGPLDGPCGERSRFRCRPTDRDTRGFQFPIARMQ